MRNVSGRSCHKIKTRFIFNNFFLQSYRLLDPVEKCGRVGQATDNNRAQRMRFTCWVSKATETLKICNIIAFHGNIGYANACLFYVIRTLPVLFGLVIVFVRPLFNLLLRICTVLYLV
jgi:hypothetical protein